MKNAKALYKVRSDKVDFEKKDEYKKGTQTRAENQIVCTPIIGIRLKHIKLYSGRIGTR